MKDRTPTHILVAIDFSPASRRALRYGADLAVQCGAALDAVHVLTPVPPMAVGPEPLAAPALLVDERKEVQEELLFWCQQTVADDLEYGVHVVEGEPAEQILACAEEIGADHLVLGAHGHSAWHDLVLGNVARDVQTRAQYPVTTLRAQDDEDE